MDKEQARFVLQSFRPDGADAQDPDFAEALSLVVEDRELGEWLARERAQDAAFAAALAGVEIPEDLRESIMEVLAGSGVGEFSEMDASFVGALASMRAPEGLRDQIVAAMTVERNRATRAAPRRVATWLGSASVAAAVALGAWLAFQVTDGPVNDPIAAGPGAGGLTLASLERGAVDVLSGAFTPDLRNQDPDTVFNYLEAAQLPTPENLPAGLKGAPLVGCKILSLEGHKASLVCFQKGSSGMVHLVVIDLDEMTGEFRALAEAKKACWQCPVTGWSRVSWADEERVFVLLGKMKPEDMAEVF